MLILFLPPPHTVVKPEFTGQQALGEGEVTWWGKKKKEEEKSPEKSTSQRPGFEPMYPELSVLSIRQRRPAKVLARQEKA